MNRDKMLAEDLTQNVFEKMIKYKSSFDGKKRFKAWLITIVRNTNVDHHQKRKYDSFDDGSMEVKTTARDALKQWAIQLNMYVLNHGDVAIDIVATYNNIYVRSF